MNRASSATRWVRNPIMKSTDLDPIQASSCELGWTYNPMSGCQNHTPEGLCLDGLFPCYAFKLANTRLKPLYLANNTGAPQDLDILEYGYAMKDPFYPRFWEERLIAADKFLKSARKPLGIFPVDMGDWCGIGIPESWSDWVLELARRYPQHRFYLLTKQARRLPEFSPFPDNCWVGMTLTGFNGATHKLADFLLVKATLKFLSLEPLLERFPAMAIHKDWFQWLIIGACTGNYQEMMKLYLKTDIPITNVMKWGKKWTLQPKIEWVKEIEDACKKAGIPYFEKDNLKPLLRRELVQEMPIE